MLRPPDGSALTGDKGIEYQSRHAPAHASSPPAGAAVKHQA